MENEVTTIEGPVHVSFKKVKNTVPNARYRMLFSKYDFITSKEKATPGVRIELKFDPTRYPEYTKRTVIDRFYFTPEAINIYQTFLMQCGAKSEMFREEVIPGEFDAEGNPLTQCVYSTKDQLDSIFGAAVDVDVIEDSYDGTAADGVTPEKQWINRPQTRGYTKIA